MRARWRLLFWASLASLIGVSWVAQAFGASLLGLMTLPVIGMIAAAATAFIAMIASYPQRWPAWLIVACVLPQAADLLHAIGFLSLLVERVGPGAALWIGGAAVTFGLALWVALAPPPPPPRSEPIARAELR